MSSLKFLAKVYSAKLPIKADLFSLQQEVRALFNNHWIDHVNTACYQGAWDVLPIRTLVKNVKQHPIIQSFSIEETGDWCFLPIIETLPLIHSVIESFQCHVEAVRLMRLKPGAHIKPHRDKGLAMEYGYARFHLPIFAAEQVDFIVNEKRIPMLNGELWYLNADAIHSVKHIGKEDRINLVIDCQVNHWLKQKIMQLDM